MKMSKTELELRSFGTLVYPHQDKPVVCKHCKQSSVYSYSAIRHLFDCPKQIAFIKAYETSRLFK